MVVSYSNDGTTTERNVQKLIIKSANFRYAYRIKHPIPGYDDLIITIAAINGQLIVMIQDSNHGLKTSRNNLFTGAKLLTLGSHIAMYQYARQEVHYTTVMSRRQIAKMTTPPSAFTPGRISTGLLSTIPNSLAS